MFEKLTPEEKKELSRDMDKAATIFWKYPGQEWQEHFTRDWLECRGLKDFGYYNGEQS